ncbi:2OG-Fe dioxygenase family protein [Candidatus Thiothrix sp. Deng01]|uniref:2OG-Fe dioxygenase family protein n=1 Tax=Candidatus Thiothrix phosphatis TaxID=3112415 RepID=A0ABU6CRZ7_9GAMM|nr:2OG-Fe dioxygenase family protein [Candidatus Thiothrix sp. Deng01]MEB4589591.1 2OG-Fe dioxygenase family protein [Candidatus Thiothrix sp. Deng01]
MAKGESNRLHQQLARRMGQAYRRFRTSWDGLLPDPYLRDGGDYRYRRYSVFHWKNNLLKVLPHEPHYQSSHYNHVHGGFNRHFRAWLPATLRNPVLGEIIRWAVGQFSADPATLWRIQAHQFRIVAREDQLGRPTPEGVHKDGAEYILIMMMDRQNIRGGISKVYNNGMHPLAEGVLEETGDLMLVNDHAVYHGVTEIGPADPAHPAWRDVLVLTFHKARG